MSERKLLTSESVTEGHPDKVCDQISDGVLDAILARDPMARVACETAITNGLVLVMGEITTTAYVDIPASPGKPSATSATPPPRSASMRHVRRDYLHQ